MSLNIIKILKSNTWINQCRLKVSFYIKYFKKSPCWYYLVANKKNAHALPDKFNPGVSMKDTYKKDWTIGPPIGQGGFGLIYLGIPFTNYL